MIGISTGRGLRMDASSVVEAISTVGFPIVCTLILAYIVYDMNEKNDAKMSEFIKMIDANTKAISELSIYIKNEIRDNNE